MDGDTAGECFEKKESNKEFWGDGFVLFVFLSDWLVPFFACVLFLQCLAFCLCLLNDPLVVH